VIHNAMAREAEREEGRTQDETYQAAAAERRRTKAVLARTVQHRDAHPWPLNRTDRVTGYSTV
jgi:hypothetical protein